MEYQKVINLLHNTSNQPSKSRTKDWVKINDKSRRTYNTNSQVKFKTKMLKSSLCDYSDAYILVKGTITVNNTAAADADVNNTNKKVIIKNCAMFASCLSEMNDTSDISVVNNNGDIVEFSGANATDSFNFKVKITGQTGESGTKEVEIIVPLKYLSSFWRTFEIFLITCVVNLILTWSGNCVTVYTDIANQDATLQ